MIAIGCDHGALELKEQLIEHLIRIHATILYMPRR